MHCGKTFTPPLGLTILYSTKSVRKTDSKNAIVISFQNVFRDLNLIAYVDYKPGL